MRLLLVTQDFPPDTGGIQTYSAQLSRHFHELCDWFGVMAPAVPGADAVDETLPYPIYRIQSSYTSFAVRSISHLWRLTREKDIDTAFHPQWQTLPASLSTRRLTGRPHRVFGAAHGRELLFNPLDDIPGARYGFDVFRRIILRRVDMLFPVSRYTASLLHKNGVPPSRIRVVNNGTDPGHFRPVDGSRIRASLDLDEQPTLLTVGRLVPRKGIDMVLRALSQIVSAVPDVTYVVAGSGPDRQRLESLARDLGVLENTRFVGRVSEDQLTEYYSACDVFVLPSRPVLPSIEGFGIVLLEANACEKPVIGSNSGGIPDAIEDGKTGFLVAPNNRDQLVERTIYLLKNPDTARQMGKQGRQRILESYTWREVAERLYRGFQG